MKIAIDARLLSTKVRGTARYLQSLINSIPLVDKTNEYYLLLYEDTSVNNNFYKCIYIKKSNLPRQLYEHYWLNFKFPTILNNFKIDIFFTPYVFVPLTSKKWKNVIVIHDSLTKVCKEYYTWHYRKYMDIMVPQSIKRSDAIITVSEHAKNDIVRYFNVPEQKIVYSYLWADEMYKPKVLSSRKKEEIMKKYNLPEDFILFVSVLEERKNIYGIIKVSDLLEQKGMPIKIVLVGREGFGFKKIEKELIKRKDRIIHIRYLPDDDLVDIYNLSKLFFFPTFYEGFGLPPLEAMSCGIPVIASNNSSIPEVVGDGGILGNAYDYEFFANNIIKLFSDINLYNKMKENALNQAKKFNAQKHISKLVEIFNSVMY